jgi:Flp pilus assembly protein TadG
VTVRDRRSTFSAKLFRRLRAERKGSAMIEFAMLAPVFFVFLLGTVEAGVMYFAQADLQQAVATAGRQIRTGADQNAGYVADSGGSTTNADWFKQQICNAAGSLLRDCTGKLQVQVVSYASGGFSNISYTSPIRNNPSNPNDPSNGTLDPAVSGYSPGSACDVVLVRAFYPWTVVTPLLTWFLTDMKSSSAAPRFDTHLMTGAAAFRNEPFTSAVSGC